MKQLALTLGLFAVVAFSQRVVPGVNPNQYQQQQQQGQYHQPPPPQYNNQQPPHQQQQQQHYQQPPQYQQQQQVPVQQQYQQPPAQHQQHPGQAPHQGQPQQVLHTNNLQHEKQHIAEHMDVPIDTSKMSEQELQFHYFKMHDSDNNNKLDGCELIKSLIHWHDIAEEGEKKHGEGEQRTEAHPQDDETLQSLIDPILELMDKDHDGYISYMEYRTAEASQAAKDAV
ncbi:multiple coagulation factor deficiency protein 2 homolog isoform X4 [Malaya genurostris]|uniref:multiple coagulation factor deficiency protein 2 homolog isoform X4 n=1 Tax=Malaya genurostris TaxID=325434 RepID=UPI0026F3E985|nr:multiple coagulation factor deficiency protein 2 homolog isoform X4 [Malaya genurostris]